MDWNRHSFSDGPFSKVNRPIRRRAMTNRTWKFSFIVSAENLEAVTTKLGSLGVNITKIESLQESDPQESPKEILVLPDGQPGETEA
jgi:hypothetical protein